MVIMSRNQHAFAMRGHKYKDVSDIIYALAFDQSNIFRAPFYILLLFLWSISLSAVCSLYA